VGVTRSEVTAAPAAAPLTRLPGEEIRERQLRSMKRRATGLLVAVTVAFLVVTLLDDGSLWSGYLRAAAEASMVGGLADWFAVTALFRHPLGLPIPHTAVIAERKEQFGRTLGEFVQGNFLNAEVMVARVRSSQVVFRVGGWLADPVHAERVARELADLLVEAFGSVRNEDAHRLLETEIGRIAGTVPLTPLAGRALRAATTGGRDQELLDAALPHIQRVLEEQRPLLRSRFGENAPRWLPRPVEGRIFDRLYDGLQELLRDVAEDQWHELRLEYRRWLKRASEQLMTSPELRARGERLKSELLEHPELRRWLAALWADMKETLRAQAADPDSELHRRIREAVMAAGRRLRDDPAVAGRAEAALEGALRYVAEHFRTEIAGLVSTTIAQWDASETSRKLELLLGRDLQFIRINGTVVGGLAGVAIHTVAEVIR
jgi:uncharacterized membrane-anchored protein YjiN (DUF445 family)